MSVRGYLLVFIMVVELFLPSGVRSAFIYTVSETRVTTGTLACDAPKHYRLQDYVRYKTVTFSYVGEL